MPKIQLFLQNSVEKIERKKCSQVLKIIEDWLKNYLFLNQADTNDEKVLRESSVLKMSGYGTSPYDNPNFCQFLYKIIEKNMLDQYLIDKRYYQSLAIEINTSISFLNLVCIMNEEQYRKVFVTKDQTMKLLKFLSSIFYVQEDHPDVAVPSILKAAVIKTFGYLIQHQNDAQYYSKSEYVCNTILDHCLSPLILQDTNINV